MAIMIPYTPRFFEHPHARSWVPWNHGEPYKGDSANYLHILARGSTHLPYASPKFGTPVYLPKPADGNTGAPPRMMGMEDGMMDSVQTAADRV